MENAEEYLREMTNSDTEDYFSRDFMEEYDGEIEETAKEEIIKNAESDAENLLYIPENLTKEEMKRASKNLRFGMALMNSIERKKEK